MDVPDCLNLSFFMCETSVIVFGGGAPFVEFWKVVEFLKLLNIVEILKKKRRVVEIFLKKRRDVKKFKKKHVLHFLFCDFL